MAVGTADTHLGFGGDIAESAGTAGVHIGFGWATAGVATRWARMAPSGLSNASFN
jgi:hypothetical protein